MNKTVYVRAGLILTVTGLLSGCATLTAPFKEADPRWADYKTWTRVTDGEVSTGDPTGSLGGVHRGVEGYREVYVNDIALDTLMGSAPYNYPAGSVIVKEQYANKADWEAGNKAMHTVSIKVNASDEKSTENWMWAESLKSTATDRAFCAGCHSVAEIRGEGDYVFTNGDFLRSLE